jgi:hypothetical protein
MGRRMKINYCCEKMKEVAADAVFDHPSVARNAEGNWFVQQWCCYDECGESPHEIFELRFCPFCGTELKSL